MNKGGVGTRKGYEQGRERNEGGKGIREGWEQGRAETMEGQEQGSV